MDASAFVGARRVPRSDRTGRAAEPRERDTPATKRLRQWLCREYKIRTEKYVRYPDEHLRQAMGLMRLNGRTVSYAWAKA